MVKKHLSNGELSRKVIQYVNMCSNSNDNNDNNINYYYYQYYNNNNSYNNNNNNYIVIGIINLSKLRNPCKL